tara:strand:- start:879 stop:1679 length:801 start_codon:yes stop_codon:yes gene_type:complete
MRLANMNRNKDLWNDWFTKYETVTHNMRLDGCSTDAESLFEHLLEFTQETWGAREIRPGRQSVTGLLEASPDQTQMSFDCSLERDFAILMSGREGVLSIEAQPVTIRYLDEFGKQQVYTPDFLVTCRKSRADPTFLSMLVEVKYQTELNGPERPKLLTKFKHAQRWAEFKRWSFAVYSEAEIRTAELSRARELLPSRFIKSSRPIQLAIMALMKSQRSTTIGGITAQLTNQFELPEIHAEIRKMLATHQLFADYDSPIDADLVIFT